MIQKRYQKITIRKLSVYTKKGEKMKAIVSYIEIPAYKSIQKMVFNPANPNPDNDLVQIYRWLGNIIKDEEIEVKEIHIF